MQISVRTCLSLIQLLLLTALAAVGLAAWHAIDNANGFTQELALLSRAQHHQQQAQTTLDELRADVNSAFSVAEGDADTAETLLASVRDNARNSTAALDALGHLQLPADLARSVADLRPHADAFIAKATAITAIAVRNPARAIPLRSKFGDSFRQLSRLNDAGAVLFSRRTATAELQAAEAAVAAQRLIIAAVVLTAALACALVALVGRSMRRSLRRLRDTASALAGGDLSVRSAIVGHDEVSELAGAVNTMADELQGLINKLRAEADRDAFGTELVEALEMSDTESEVHSVVSRAMEKIATDRPMELLLSDSSRAHLERASQHPNAGAPGCGVESPFSCLAVRRGNPVVFEDSDALNACPRLRDRPCGPVSAVCVPVSFMGRSLGVLHTTGLVRQVPSTEQVAQLTVLGIQSGARIGTVRAFERTQIQASTDGLTGLNNRRSLEQTARGLLTQNAAYTFVLADLDHFKRLNDGHGHEAGDKALRLFSDVLKKRVRQGDLAARWGGEEFAILFPGASAQQIFEVIERLRADLAQALLISNTVPFTASFGIADSTMASRFEDVVRMADEALYGSKNAGRDRTTIADPAQPRVPAQRPTEQRAAINMQMLVNEN